MREARMDQALGLRRLFEQRGARVLPVVSGEGVRPGRAALAIARSLNEAGHRCLIIDASRGDVARVLGLAARYELRHVALGDRRLRDVLLKAGDDIRVLPASRGLAGLLESPRPSEKLASLARELGIREDWILIAADSANAETAAQFAGGAEVAIAARRGAAGRTAAYAVMKRIVQATATQRFRFLAEDGAGPAQGESADAECGELDRIAARFLGASVAGGGSDPRGWSCAQLN